MKSAFFPALLSFTLPFLAQCQHSDEGIEVAGLLMSRDQTGVYVRNVQGQSKVEWNGETKVALELNTRLLAGLEEGMLHYRIQSSNEIVVFTVPKGPITGEVEVRLGKQLETALKEAADEKWISERGLRLYFSQKPEVEKMATEDDPTFVGAWNWKTKPRTLDIGGTGYEISLKKGGQTNALLFNILKPSDLKPFTSRVTVIGREADGVIVADEIHVMPIGDQAASDDPKLPRYLFIGDSISSNYSKGLRDALAGKFNLHHPPANCGSTEKGCEYIASWLGGYQEKGRHWDVISFNHGHWDVGNDKETYQENLEVIIGELKETKAKLIWVTTCPVPNGCPPAGELDENGRAPGRMSNVMKKFMNPWAAEVMARHPEITVCDQWQYTKDHEADLYKDWWQGDNVHFNAEQGAALGNFLADHVIQVAGSMN